jgi:hypothetical protein
MSGDQIRECQAEHVGDHQAAGDQAAAPGRGRTTQEVAGVLVDRLGQVNRGRRGPRQGSGSRRMPEFASQIYRRD